MRILFYWIEFISIACHLNRPGSNYLASRGSILCLVLIAAVASLLSGCWRAPDSLQLQTTRLDVQVLLDGLEIPWDMSWSEDGWIWFSQKNGQVSRFNPDSGELQQVLAIDEVFQSADNSGLHALALHPQFPAQPYVYLHFTYSQDNSRLVRYRFNEDAVRLEDGTVLLDELPANVSHNGSRIVFSPHQDTLFLALGDAYNPASAQDISLYSGKILRINLDGSVPDDNPFPGSLVWSYGHRNPQGLVMAGNGRLYSSEHGEANDDELNLVERGRNYGHPQVRGYCDTPEEIELCAQQQITEPLQNWSPTFGVAGIAYYDHPAIPEWRNSILVTSLKSFYAEGGKRLQVLKLNEAGDQVVQVNDYLVEDFGRLREVMVSPDGRVFLFTSNREINDNKPRIRHPGDDRLIVLQAMGEP